MGHPLRTLIVEDSEEDTILLVRELRKSGYDPVFVRVDKPEPMKQALAGQEWDLIISDYVLPQFSGLAALNVFQKTGLDLPFLIVSGNIGEDIAVKMMKAGAHDYIMKDNLKRLVPAVERELREAEVRRERRHAREVQEFSLFLLQIANRCTAIPPLLQEFIEEIKKFSGCAALGIRLLNADGSIPYEAYTGFPQEFYRQESPLSVKSDQCMCINVIRGATDPRLPFYTEGGSFYMNATTDFLATVSEEEKGQTRNTCNTFGYESVALIPISAEGHIIGVLHLADLRKNRVPLRKVQVLEGVALQIGTAIQRIRAEESLQQSARQLRHLSSQLLLAQEQERKRIAHDLHDGLAADLAAIKYRLEKKVISLDEQTPIRREALQEIIGNIQRSIEEIRRIMNNLHPSILDDLGILATIKWVCREIQSVYSQITVEREIAIQEDDIPKALHIVIFRVVQEALNNVVKHSRADRVRICLALEGGSVHLRVEDNGRGFDVREKTSSHNGTKGLGLGSMRERVELSGGDFRLESYPGRGTTVEASWTPESSPSPARN